MSRAIYSGAFFTQQEAESLLSARIIAPIVFGIVRPTSVLDVGCGVGAWLLAFLECGAQRVCGYDGEYVKQAALLIEECFFHPVNLETSCVIPGQYDLAICIEVAEHLSPTAGNRVVDALARAAPIVLFSAAVPGQGGVHHINEQWPQYWDARFARHQYVRLDFIRRRIADDSNVSWWLKQNLRMYVRHDVFGRSPALTAERDGDSGRQMEHVGRDWLEQFSTVGGLLRHLSWSVRRAMKRYAAGVHR